jgi:hypothetical protein
MFDALPQRFQKKPSVQAPVITVNSQRTQLSFDVMHIVDPSGGAVYLYLPSATPDDVGRGVSIDRRSVPTTITVVAAGGQRVHASPTDAIPTGTGVHGYVWAGDMWRYRRGG